MSIEERLLYLQGKLPKNSDAALIISPINRKYFTSFYSTDGILLITRKSAVFFTDSRYIEKAQSDLGDIFEVIELKKRSEQLDAEIKKRRLNAIACEAEYMTIAYIEKLKKDFPLVAFIADGQLDDLITEQRRVKSPEELQHIRDAQHIAEKAFLNTLDFIKPGRTENEIRVFLDCEMLKYGAEEVSFPTIAAGGTNSSCPHATPTDYVLRHGDFLTLDFGAVSGGYHSDTTRTIAVGAVSLFKREIYELVLTAQRAGLSIVRAGIKASDVDTAVRTIIREAGYGDFFRHSTGHGVGLEIHEKCALAPHSEAVLQVGEVVSIEPGIYYPGEFGVRIEDIISVTRDGFENLTSLPK